MGTWRRGDEDGFCFGPSTPCSVQVLRLVPHIPRPMAPVINRRGLGKVQVQGTPGLAGTGAVNLWPLRAFSASGDVFPGLTETGSSRSGRSGRLAGSTMPPNGLDLEPVDPSGNPSKMSWMQPRAGEHALAQGQADPMPYRDIAAEGQMPD